MEDALVLTQLATIWATSSRLNPCFNGRCTRTRANSAIRRSRAVLILVLMEDALVPMANAPNAVANVCLNPCFNGRCTRTGTFLDACSVIVAS